MPSADPAEHFVTLFDRNFLPAGLCLLHSLRNHARPFRLWVVCMDEVVEEQLLAMELPEVSLLPLREVEDDRLRAVKPSRNVAEYCWTLTPFTPAFVMARAPEVKRVTYLDADLYFFDRPERLLAELEQSGAHVLITEHAYAMEYALFARAGIYCVQFVTFNNSPEGRSVLGWWQERCLEWCYARVEDGKFGDQKYLDDWPRRFGGNVRVLQARQLALGPWNTTRFKTVGAAEPPVFFHFHGLRLVSAETARLYWGYRISKAAQDLYREYADTLARVVHQVKFRHGVSPVLPEPPGFRRAMVRLALGLLGYASYRRLPFADIQER